MLYFETSASIKHIGLLEDILVRPRGDYYEIVHGERRWRACKLVGLETIRAKIVTGLSDPDAFELGLVENIQRENLTPVEEAFALKQYLDKGMRQAETAEKLGKKKKKIAERLKLLSSHYYTQYQEEEIAQLRERIRELEGGSKQQGGESEKG